MDDRAELRPSRIERQGRVGRAGLRVDAERDAAVRAAPRCSWSARYRPGSPRGAGCSSHRDPAWRSRPLVVQRVQFAGRGLEHGADTADRGRQLRRRLPGGRCVPDQAERRGQPEAAVGQRLDAVQAARERLGAVAGRGGSRRPRRESGGTRAARSRPARWCRGARATPRPIRSPPSRAPAPASCHPRGPGRWSDVLRRPPTNRRPATSWIRRTRSAPPRGGRARFRGGPRRRPGERCSSAPVPPIQAPPSAAGARSVNWPQARLRGAAHDAHGARSAIELQHGGGRQQQDPIGFHGRNCHRFSRASFEGVERERRPAARRRAAAGRDRWGPGLNPGGAPRPGGSGLRGA